MRAAVGDPADRLPDLASSSLEIRQAAATELGREMVRLETAGDRAGLARIAGLLRRAAQENPDIEAREEAGRILAPFLAGAAVWEKKVEDLPGVPIRLARSGGRIAAGGLAYPRGEDDDEERGWVGVYDEATGRTLWETGPKGIGWPVGHLVFSGDALFAAGENEEGIGCVVRLDATTGAVTARTRFKRTQVWSLNPIPGGGVLASGIRQVDPEEGWQGRSEGWLCVLDAAGEKTWEKRVEPASMGAIRVRDGRFWLGGRSGETGWLCVGDAARAPDAASFWKLPFQSGAACPFGSSVVVEGRDRTGTWLHFLNSEGKVLWKNRIGGLDVYDCVLGLKEIPHGILAWGWSGRSDPKWMWGWALDVGMSSWVALHDPATGKRLWRVEGLRDFPGYVECDIPATARGILVLTRADAGGGERFLAIDPATGRARIDKVLRFPGKADAFLSDADGRRFFTGGVIVGVDEDGELDDELGQGGWIGAYRACDADGE